MLYIFKRNLVLKKEIRVKMTIANQCTGERNHLLPFLMKKFKPIKIAFAFVYTKNSLLTLDKHYL